MTELLVCSNLHQNTSSEHGHDEVVPAGEADMDMDACAGPANTQPNKIFHLNELAANF